MKKIRILVALLTLCASSAAHASNVGVDLNLRVGNPPPPPQVIVQPPPPHSGTVIVEEDIDFVYPDPLGFYVAIGVPYDLFFLRGQYYLFRDNHWYRGAHHRGPWVEVKHRNLPPGLRKHKMERVHYYRDREYRTYERERDRYRGKHFRSGKDGWKEEKRERKEEWKEEKRREKEERKHGRGRGRDD